MTIVELKKQGMHCVDDPNCFNKYHPEVPEKAKANVGDMIVYHTRDALETEFRSDSISADLAAADLGLVHPMTGPVHINGVECGDAVEVEIVDIVPDQYEYTVIAPGFGFLHDIFAEPYMVNWQLTRTGAVSPGMPGIAVPYEAFPGSIGVMPGMSEIEKIKAREAGLSAVGGVLLSENSHEVYPLYLPSKDRFNEFSKLSERRLCNFGDESIANVARIQRYAPNDSIYNKLLPLGV